MIRRFALASAILIAAGSAAPAMAGALSADVEVTATVPNNCTISTSSIGFGNYDPIGSNSNTPLTASGSVTITCTKEASASITLGQGSNAGEGSTDSTPARRLHNNFGDFLSYQIYQDSNLNTVWGNTADTGVLELGNGAEQEKTVFGRIAAGQNNVPAGSYSDIVSATVTF
mgnify:FL=1